MERVDGKAAGDYGFITLPEGVIHMYMFNQ